jgi:hypothetical protein
MSASSATSSTGSCSRRIAAARDGRRNRWIVRRVEQSPLPDDLLVDLDQRPIHLAMKALRDRASAEPPRNAVLPRTMGCRKSLHPEPIAQPLHQTSVVQFLLVGPIDVDLHRFAASVYRQSP